MNRAERRALDKYQPDLLQNFDREAEAWLKNKLLETPNANVKELALEYSKLFNRHEKVNG